MLRCCRSLFTSLLLLLLTGLVPLSVSAQVPHDMAYQGVLTDAVGAPLTGPVTLVFRVFDQPSGGTPLYTETLSDVAIDPMEGAFLVRLGLGATDLDTDGDGAAEANPHAFDASLFENGPNRYLEIQVGSGVSGEILSPRRRPGRSRVGRAPLHIGSPGVSGFCVVQSEKACPENLTWRVEPSTIVAGRVRLIGCAASRFNARPWEGSSCTSSL